MADCIFCEIVAGRAPAHVVWEDARTLAFMDIMPVADGHVLVIPKAHSENLFEIDPADLRAVADGAHAVAGAIRRALAPDGLGAFQLNGAAAGQTVFHYHQHLIPRSHGAELRLHGRRPAEPARLAELARRIADALEPRTDD